jgi:serine/threonine protein kinase
MDEERSTRGERKDREGSVEPVSVKDAFASALDVLDDGGDLESALAGVDEAVRGAVADLLAAHRRASGKLLDATDDTQTGWSGLHDGRAEAGIVIEPPQIEGYEIGDEIGRGGFGVVFRALQRVPVERAVAVKLLRHELASRGVVRRFRAEGRLLARMNHAGIARVLDAGLDRRGRPYVVMELVEGAPITAVCEQNELPVRDRVALMAQVCEAVHHAHQRAIIHRDLKPQNMLVESVDGSLRPRVIDFGIAKLLDDDDGHTATIAGDRLGTPKYMSPEQREGKDSADVRTDVYALGVVLCEVLTGRVPGVDDSGRNSGSGLVGGSGIGSGSGLRSGGRSSFGGGIRPSVLAEADPRTHARAKLLKGDLDRIVMKATARYPEARYPSAMAMGQDLRRYLDGLPVAATPPGPVYLAKKFIGRHRTIAALAVLLAVSVAAAIAALGYGAREARLGRVEAERALGVAEEERVRAETMAGFLLGNMLTAIDPDLYQGEDRSLQAILRTTASEALASLSEEPLVLLEVLERVGQSQRAIGDTLGAAETLTEAAVLAAAHRGAGDASTIELRLDVLLMRLSSRQQINYGAEIAYLERMAEEHLPAEHATRYRTQVHRLHALSRDERPEHAKRMEQRIAASAHAGTAVHFEAMRYLANIYLSEDPAAALKLAERALEDSVERYGQRHSQTIEVRFTFAQALSRVGRTEEAEREYALLLEHTQAVGGEQSVYYQTALANLVVMLRDRGEIGGALELAERQVELARAQYGEISSQYAAALRQIAMCHHARGAWDDADAAFTRALGAYRRYDRPQMIEALLTRLEYGQMLVDAGRWERAADVVQLAIETLAPGHEVRVRAAVVMAAAMERLEGLEAAQRFVDAELEEAERASGRRPFRLEHWRDGGQ